MEETGRRHGHFIKGFLMGGTLGGLAALLFAPRCGKELRSNLKQTKDKVFHKARSLYDHANRRVSDVSERAKNFVTCVREKGAGSPQPTAGSPTEMVWEA